MGKLDTIEKVALSFCRRVSIVLIVLTLIAAALAGVDWVHSALRSDVPTVAFQDVHSAIKRGKTTPEDASEFDEKRSVEKQYGDVLERIVKESGIGRQETNYKVFCDWVQ